MHCLILLTPLTSGNAITHKASKERTLVVELKDDYEEWAKQESSKHLDQRDKTNLSKLRRGSYTEKWLAPNKVDTRDSDEDTFIRTTDGVIRASKVNGELICILIERDGKTRSFYCGDPILNILQNKSGSIKNSDREEWEFND